MLADAKVPYFNALILVSAALTSSGQFLSSTSNLRPLNKARLMHKMIIAATNTNAMLIIKIDFNF